jgi:hypothetical protein
MTRILGTDTRRRIIPPPARADHPVVDGIFIIRFSKSMS